MIQGVTFGIKHSYEDFGLILSSKKIIELKNQIISLSYYAGLSHDQIQELKKKCNLK